MKFTKEVKVGSHDFQPLPKRLLLKGGTIVDPGQRMEKKSDVVIQSGKIVEVGAVDENGFNGTVLDMEGKFISPGWMDMHVHLREPGREDEETIQSGSLAAANGGFTAVCCMPNTTPPIDSQEIIQYIKDRARNSLVDVYPIAAITKKRAGEELAEILDLVEQGAVAISDDGSPVMSAEMMRRALEYSKMVAIPVIGHEEDLTMTANGHINEGYVSTCLGLGGIPSVAEDIMIARDIMLTEYCGGHFHVAHISTRESVELVRQAKKRGVAVSAEVTPHHFSLTDEAVRGYDTNAKMKPPLRTQADVDAILEGLQDNTIDAIATDHAPHSWEEKASEFIYAPFGIVGLETALGLSFTKLYHTRILSLSSLIEKFTVNPYRILGITPPAVKKGEPANLTIFDSEVEWSFSDKHTLSKSTNSPFIGWQLKGKPHAVINRGKFFMSIL